MAYIRQIDPAEAEGALREVYASVTGPTGRIPSVYRVMGLDAASLRASIDTYRAVMHADALPVFQKELIACVVSNINGCLYCTLSHAAYFTRKADTKALGDQLVRDYRGAALNPADRALCDFAARLTVAPGSMGERDIAALRGHGFTDEQVSAAVQVVAYFNSINRIALGLGVDRDAGMAMSQAEWDAVRGRDYAATALASG